MTRRHCIFIHTPWPRRVRDSIVRFAIAGMGRAFQQQMEFIPTRGLRLYWLLLKEEWYGRLFAWAYVGSTREIQDGIQFAKCGVHSFALTPLQREIKSRLSEWADQEEVQ